MHGGSQEMVKQRFHDFFAHDPARFGLKPFGSWVIIPFNIFLEISISLLGLKPPVESNLLWIQSLFWAFRDTGKLNRWTNLQKNNLKRYCESYIEIRLFIREKSIYSTIHLYQLTINQLMNKWSTLNKSSVALNRVLPRAFFRSRLAPSTTSTAAAWECWPWYWWIWEKWYA